jgi:hypothetical protein
MDGRISIQVEVGISSYMNNVGLTFKPIEEKGDKLLEFCKKKFKYTTKDPTKGRATFTQDWAQWCTDNAHVDFIACKVPDLVIPKMGGIVLSQTPAIEMDLSFLKNQ